jgi:hypothetical protein
MKTKKHGAIVLSSNDEENYFREFAEHLKNAPLPNDEMLANLGLFLTSKTLARILFFYEIYKKLIYNHGVIMEFGVRWGQSLSLLCALRGIFEPFNRHRRIIGFDTFQGLKGVSAWDGKCSSCSDGDFSVSPEYDKYLARILFLQEQLNPMAHLPRYELVKGDAVKTIPAYFKQHSETIVSLAIFDFDIYKPTKSALKWVKRCLAKGSILVFDELCDNIFPGETRAVQEILGINNIRIQRMPFASRISYVEIK